MKQDKAYSDLKEIKIDVPQGSMLGPVLYLLYTSDFPTLTGVKVATFANETALLVVLPKLGDSTSKL